MGRGINYIHDSIKEFSSDIAAKYDQMLIQACKNKGLVMSVETANQYRVLEILNKPYCILEHVASGIKICQYSKEPTYMHVDNKIIAEWNFKEL